MKRTKGPATRPIFAFFAGLILVFALTALMKNPYSPTEAAAEIAPESLPTTDKIASEMVKSNLRTPRSLDFHVPTANLLLASRAEAKLEIISSKTPNRFLSGEIPNIESLAAVRTKNSAFDIGEVFLGLENGQIWRLSADGSHITKIRLTGGNSPLNSLAVADGKLFAADEAGHVWRVTEKNRAEIAFSLKTPLKGLAFVPDDFSRYGLLAGKLLAGAPELGGIFVLDEVGAVVFYPLNFKTADLDLIAGNENLFGTNIATGRIFQISAGHLTNFAGDILVTSSETNELLTLRWNGSEFEVKRLETAEKLDQVVFAPIDLTENAGGSCVTSLSQIENVFQWEAGESSFDVSAPANCSWTAVSNAPWLVITGGQSGTGNGTLSYRVSKNETLFLREAVITIGQLTHHVRQSRKAQLQCRLQFTPSTGQIGAAGGNGTVTVAGSSECAWQVASGVPWLTVTSNPFGRGNGSVSFSSAVNFGGQERIGYLSFSNGSVAITQAANLAPQVFAGLDQTVTLPNTASLSGTAADDGIGNPVTVSWSKLSGDESVLFSSANNLQTTAIFSKEGTYVLRLTATDGYLTTTDDVQITVNADPTPLPPDPIIVAPQLEQTVPTNIAKATEFIYTGANPIQTGVNPSNIKPERVGLIRGRVVGKNGQPIPNVKISILDHPEFGQTRSRADGIFDLVVNGGGDLTVKYEKQGFIASQREEKIDWQEYTKLEDVVLISYDGNVSFIDLNSNAPIQVAESGVITDADGTRRSRLFFKQGTNAVMTLPDNSTQNLTEMHVRSTEFTVGANGAETMPGELPPTSAYTYASEYSVDEAVALSATDITFSQPVAQYNENFLNFPVGIDVPSGAYDEETATWIPSANGRVVKILSITGGAANLDLDGNGNPANETAYNALGINLAEREKLAQIYAAGQTLWRVPVIHFSSWDSNWGFGPPDDAEPPNAPPPQCDT